MGVMLITGAVTLVTWAVMLVTQNRTCVKRAARLLDRTLLERVGDKVVEMCRPSTFISWLSHLICSGQAPGQALSERVRGRALEKSPSASWSAFILQFP